MRIFDPEVLLQDLAGPRLLPRGAGAVQRLHQPAARHHPGHRPHRLGQDHHALLGAQARSPAASSTSPPSRTRSRWCTTSSTRPRCRPRSASPSPRRCATSCARTPTSSWWARSATQETAQYAIQAALTGHLVFSTLHTNDAATSITPPGRPRRRALPDQLDPDRRHGAAPGAQDLPAAAPASATSTREEAATLRLSVPDGQAHQGARRARAATSAAAPATSGAPASSRSCRSTTPIKHLIVERRRRPGDQARGGQERHAHPAPVGAAQAGRGRDHLRGSGAGHRALSASPGGSCSTRFANRGPGGWPAR